MKLPDPYSIDHPAGKKAKGLFRRLAVLRRNICRLSRFDLDALMDDHYIDLSSYSYEISDIAARTRIPRVKDPVETLDMLVSGDKSFVRIGDGELKIMGGAGIPFQVADEGLARRMREAVMEPCENLEVGFSWVYFHPDTIMQRFLREYNWNYMRSSRTTLLKYMDVGREYYAAEITQLYQMFDGRFDFSSYFEKFRSIWDGRDVVLACGSKTFGSLVFNVFDNARSVEKVEGPSANAWSEYDAILENVKRAARGKLVLVILGPAGKVLTSDLARAGIRAIDVGHVAKDYDAYRRGAPKDWASVLKFFSPE